MSATLITEPVGPQAPPSLIHDLGEFNVVKEGPDEARMIFVDGTILEGDLDQAAAPLALALNTFEGALAELHAAGFTHTEEDLRDYVESFRELDLLETRTAPPGYAYRRDRALGNLRSIERGAVTVWETAITLLDACPMRCSFCFRKDFGLKVELKLEHYVKLMKSLQRLGCVTLNISGGEPSLVWKLVRDVTAAAREHEVERVSVNTTGFRLTDDILAEWLGAGLGCMNLALDSVTPAIHDGALKKEGAWLGAVESLRAAKRVGLPVHVNCTVFGENAGEVDDLIEFAFAEGATWVRVNPYVPQRGNTALTPHVNWRIAESVAQARKRGLMAYTPVDREEIFPDYMTCSAGLTKAVIETDGSVGGCQYLGNENGPGLNLQTTDFFDLWTLGNWEYFRSEFPEITGLCKSCTHRSYCVGNCLAVSRSLFGDAKLVGFHECEWYEASRVSSR